MAMLKTLIRHKAGFMKIQKKKKNIFIKKKKNEARLIKLKIQ
jgi:hypothetical protein